MFAVQPAAPLGELPVGSAASEQPEQAWELPPAVLRAVLSAEQQARVLPEPEPLPPFAVPVLRRAIRLRE